jgi:coatomer subunit beta'
MRGNDSLLFYDWASSTLVRRLEVTPMAVYWAPSRSFLVITTATDAFVLAYNASLVDAALASGEVFPEGEGLEEAFSVTEELSIAITSGIWAGDCFFFVDSGKSMFQVHQSDIPPHTSFFYAAHRFCYLMGAESVPVARLDRLV